MAGRFSYVSVQPQPPTPSPRMTTAQGGVIPAGAVAVLASRRNNKSDGLKGGPGAWFAQYFAKAKGGPVHMPEPANRGDAFVTWGGTFISIGLLESVFNLMNGDIHWRGQVREIHHVSGG